MQPVGDTDEAMLVRPAPDDPRLTMAVSATDQTGAVSEIRVPMERSLTLFLKLTRT